MFPVFAPTYKDNYEHLAKYIKMIVASGEKLTSNYGSYFFEMKHLSEVVNSMIKSFYKEYSTIEFTSTDGSVSFIMTQEKMKEIEDEIANVKNDIESFKKELIKNGTTIKDAADLLQEFVVLGKQIKESYNSGNKEETETRFKRFYEIMKQSGRKALPFLVAATPALIEMIK